MEEQSWQQFLTERVLGGCWHELTGDQPGCTCKKCGAGFSAIHYSDWNPKGFVRTFTTRNDLMDLYQQVYEDGKWDDFFWDFAFKRKPENYGLGEAETSVWLFCLNGEDYAERCKMVAEFYGWEGK